MQEVLNLTKEEALQLYKILEKKSEKIGAKTSYELQRFKEEGCVITIYKTGKVLFQGKNAEAIVNEILKELKLAKELILGIDEAGRGESFGSLVICGVLAYSNMLRFCRDSKKIRKQKLKQIVERITQNAIAVKCVSFSSREIDSLRKQKTMNEIISDAIDKIIDEMKSTGLRFKVRIDGSPLKIKHKAEFIVGGDDKDAVIAAASIVAKFKREIAEKGKRLTWKNNN